MLTYEMHISPKMREVGLWLKDQCVGMNHCVYELGRNLVVEVPKSDCESVVKVLKKRFEDVVLITKAYAMLEDLHDYILVKQMISESPLFEQEEMSFPSLEKQLVDLVSDKMYEGADKNAVALRLQHAFEAYDVNPSKMLRYASRKGKKEEVQERIEKIDIDRIQMIKSIQQYLSATPFEKVWLFGSFSRMEEGPDSDIDLLAQLGKSRPMGLMELSGIVLGLEAIVHRKIDLVLDGAVKPFARESIDKNKVLIYERTR